MHRFSCQCFFFHITHMGSVFTLILCIISSFPTLNCCRINKVLSSLLLSYLLGSKRSKNSMWEMLQGTGRALTTTSSFLVARMMETNRTWPRFTPSSPSNTLRSCFPVEHTHTHLVKSAFLSPNFLLNPQELPTP